MWKVGDGPFTRIAIDYAEQVIAGGVPACRQIHQAAQRFLDDIDGDKWEFNPSEIERVCDFTELLPHVKAGWASRKEFIRLEPWQVWILAAIFGFTNPATGKRKVREAFLLIPRKQGKSTLAAVIGLYMAFLDGEAGAEVYIGANSTEQAQACFGPCRKMAERSPDFTEAYGIEVMAKSLVVPGDGSFVKMMIAKPGDGSNPHCAILDEAHENDSSDQYDTMKTGMGSREQPLILTITTAGFNLAGPCRQRQLDAEAVLAGQMKDDRLFAAIYTIDKDDDWKDFNTWKKANPNCGVSVSEEYLRAQLLDALQKPAEKAGLLTKHLNVWQNSASGWLNQLDWIACADRTGLTIDDLTGRPAWLGLDIATQKDLTCVFSIVDVDGTPHLFPFFFIPEGAIEGSKNAGAYAEWIDRGFLTLTPGNMIDFETIKNKVYWLRDTLDIKGVAYDQWQGAQLAQELDAAGVPNIQRFIQSPGNYNPIMRRFEALVADHKLKHDGNPCLNWMAANVSVRPGPKDLLYPNKPDGQIHLKIDGIVAALMAMGMQMMEPEVANPFIDFF